MSLWKKSAGYALGRGLSSGLGFLLLPVLTRLLTPDVYGTWQILMFYAALVMVIAQLGMDQALYRFYVLDRENRGKYLSIVFITILLTSIILFLLTFITKSTIRTLLVGKTINDSLIVIASLWGLTDAFFFTTLTVFQSEENVRLFVICEFLRAILAYGMAITAITAGYGLQGLMLSWIISAFAVLFLVAPLIIKRLSKPGHIIMVFPMLAYGFPLSVNLLIIRLFSFTDRWLLARLGSLSAVGAYSAGLKIAVIVQAILTPVRQAWLARIFIMYKHGILRDRLPNLWRQLAGVLGIVTITVALLSPEIFKLMIGPGYESGMKIVPLLAIAFFLDGLMIIADAGIYVTGKTTLIPTYTFIATILNVVLCIFLIPKFGEMGAAISVVASYFILFIMLYKAGQFLFPVKIPKTKVLIVMLCIGVGAWVAINISEFLIRFAVLLVLYAAIILSSSIDKDIVKFIKSVKNE
jgi:O-antigen/teichoic acid export membrane protein